MMLPCIPLLAVLSVLPSPQTSELRGPMVKVPQVVEVRDSSVPAEGYRLAIASNAVTVTASDDAGLFYARETLRQLQDADGRIPSGTVVDAPRYPFRCIHVDDGRHFFGKANMLRTLAIALAQALWHPIGGFDCNSMFLPAVKRHVEQLRREGVNAARLPVRSQQALW